MTLEVLHMYGGCDCGPSYRSFLTKDEKIELLKEYKDHLEKEAKGVAERIKDMEKAK